MEIRSCNYCHKQADLVCYRCRDPYCSRQCQQIDWPQHKLFCFPMPSLVKPFNEVTSTKSEPNVDNHRSTSPSTKFRHMKLSQECDANLMNGNSNRQLSSANKGNIPNSIDSAKVNNVSTSNVASVDRSYTNDKPEVRSPVKPTYYKTDNVDPASIRKPGTLSQVVAKAPTVQQPIQVTVEPPKQAPTTVAPMTQAPTTVAPMKQAPTTVAPMKQAPTTVAPMKQAQTTAAPTTVAQMKPTKQETIDSPKQINVVKAPLQDIVEQPKQIEAVEAVRIPKKVETTPPAAVAATELKIPKVEPVSPTPQMSPGAWMKSTPIGEIEYANVIIQYVGTDGIAWVSLVNEDAENNNLLREINKRIAVASTPNPSEVVVNALFIVPFEGIYYRAVVLEPVSLEKGTVSVRLVDFGNQFDLPIGELKSPLPSVTEKKAYAFPIKFRNPRNAEIGNCLKIKKESIDNGVVTVVVEGEAPMTTMKDIDVAPIPIGTNIDLICLDFSNTALGYISACIADAKAVQFVEGMGPKMSKHCGEVKDEYSPRVDELCLVQFEDGEWYRAVTRKVIDADNFEIMFIDYGNIITVKRSAIRKMIDDFLHPCMMNICFIKGFPKTPTKEDIHKTALYFNDHQAFKADAVEKDGDKYVIQVTI